MSYQRTVATRLTNATQHLQVRGSEEDIKPARTWRRGSEDGASLPKKTKKKTQDQEVGIRDKRLLQAMGRIFSFPFYSLYFYQFKQ